MADELDASVEEIRAKTGADRVDIVGVSLGGLIGLWWLKHLGGHARAERFVAVGSPFRGTWVALLGIATLGLVSKGAWQMVPNSKLIRELAGPSPVPTTIISMTGDHMAPPERCRLPEAKTVVLDAPWVPGIAHQTLVLSGKTIDGICDALKR
ncbi:MAG: hypothetical protein GWP91_24135 [Rhodobacterales bacterium]|nr:hypothetical protein [Rhodobacterales bacterium]